MQMFNRFFIILICFHCSVIAKAQSFNLPEQNDRWAIQQDGRIEWKIDNRLPHSDHIEMSGQKVSLWMQYGVDTSGRSNYIRTIVFQLQ